MWLPDSASPRAGESMRPRVAPELCTQSCGRASRLPLGSASVRQRPVGSPLRSRRRTRGLRKRPRPGLGLRPRRAPTILAKGRQPYPRDPGASPPTPPPMRRFFSFSRRPTAARSGSRGAGAPASSAKRVTRSRDLDVRYALKAAQERTSRDFHCNAALPVSPTIR